MSPDGSVFVRVYITKLTTPDIMRPLFKKLTKFLRDKRITLCREYIVLKTVREGSVDGANDEDQKQRLG